MIEVHFYSLNDERYNTEVTATLGPFPYVQMTYDTLRDHEGQIVAAFDCHELDWQLTRRMLIDGQDGWAENVPYGARFSDLEIREVAG